MKLETDKDGMIMTKPVTGWSIHAMQDIAILLAIEYVDTPEQLKTGPTYQIQLALLPQQCLELANVLTRSGNKLLENPSTQKPS